MKGVEGMGEGREGKGCVSAGWVKEGVDPRGRRDAGGKKIRQ